MGELLRKSLVDARVVDKGGYQYFVHPLTDGIPAIEPGLLREVVAEMRATLDLRGADRILTVEAMGIPLATALSLDTGIPIAVIRKRRYGFDDEQEIGQTTGYSKGALYVNGLSRGDRIVFVDDVISTGGTLGALIPAFRQMGLVIQDIGIVVEKGEGREALEREHGVRIRTLQRVEVRDGRVRLL
ncbi:MAG TPA: hypoxanthine/guanine phosphoribosyltransferase [Candidatus Thermoplasmatota archaeon]|nr:hypoxanthine/guanine phosphoribosyltransferase [Candidatus Thermoplasmatota archaeon]